MLFRMSFSDLPFPPASPTQVAGSDRGVSLPQALTLLSIGLWIRSSLRAVLILFSLYSQHTVPHRYALKLKKTFSDLKKNNLDIITLDSNYTKWSLSNCPSDNAKQASPNLMYEETSFERHSVLRQLLVTVTNTREGDLSWLTAQFMVCRPCCAGACGEAS